MENKAMSEPKSLQEAVIYFANPDNCIHYLSIRRWPDGKVTCPTCGCETVKFSEKRRTWTCAKHHAKREFSVKVGTVMEDSAIPLDKWMTATWMITNCKNGVSSYEIAKAVRVSQKSAWFMLHRVRLAMQDDTLGSKFGAAGEVEVDESFIGGKMANRHKSRRLHFAQVRSETQGADGVKHMGKTAVQGILDRDLRRVRAKVVLNVKRETLQYEILNQVEFGAKLYSDNAVAYNELASIYAHDVVNHAVEYVNGRVHTNGLENFWSLLKRGLHGTYVAVEPFHLFRYVDEQVFRYNNRATKDNPLSDSDRFALVVSQMLGKRLTFAEVTGKSGETLH
jgi:transposase-like protein